MKSIKRLPYVLLFTACFVTAASFGIIAQSIPPLINYQGQIQDSKGFPLATADYVLSISLFDAASGGKLIWGPQSFDGQTLAGHGLKVPVVQGYFNVMLGPVDVTGASINTAFAQENRFLEIKVGDAPPISPRQQILSTPFAFRSGFAESAGKAALADTASIALKATRAEVADRATIADSVANAGASDTAKVADQARDAVKLAGFDWSALFGVNDPVNGLFPGARLKESSIAFSKLALREMSSDAGEGGIAISSPAVPSDPTDPGRGFRCATPTVVDVTGLTVSLRTTGRPVYLTLIPEVSKQNRTEAPSTLQEGREQNMMWVLSAGGDNYGYLFFVADGDQVAMLSFRAGPSVHEAVSGILSQIVVLPRPGRHTFKVQAAYRGSSASGMEIHNLRLVAFEL